MLEALFPLHIMCSVFHSCSGNCSFQKYWKDTEAGDGVLEHCAVPPGVSQTFRQFQKLAISLALSGVLSVGFLCLPFVCFHFFCFAFGDSVLCSLVAVCGVKVLVAGEKWAVSN